MMNKEIIDRLKKLYGNPEKPAPKYVIFVHRALIVMVVLAVLINIIFLVQDHQIAKEAVKIAKEKIENSPEMQKWRAAEAKRRRETERKRRLKELGIDGEAKPKQKDDLINAKLRERAKKQEEELMQQEEKNFKEFDYSAELEAYNAKLKEVQDEEARLRAEEEAKEKAEQERIALQEKKEEERRQAALKQKQEQEEKALAAKIKAEQAAKKQAKVKVLPKTEKKSLQTNKSSFGSSSSFGSKSSFGSSSGFKPK